MASSPRKSGRTQLEKIREWLQRTIDGRHKMRSEQIGQTQWRGRLSVGRVPISLGFGKSKREADENAYIAAYAEYLNKPSQLVSYYKNFQQGSVFIPLPRFPPEEKARPTGTQEPPEDSQSDDISASFEESDSFEAEAPRPQSLSEETPDPLSSHAELGGLRSELSDTQIALNEVSSRQSEDHANLVTLQTKFAGLEDLSLRESRLLSLTVMEKLIHLDNQVGTLAKSNEPDVANEVAKLAGVVVQMSADVVTLAKRTEELEKKLGQEMREKVRDELSGKVEVQTSAAAHESIQTRLPGAPQSDSIKRPQNPQKIDVELVVNKMRRSLERYGLAGHCGAALPTCILFGARFIMVPDSGWATSILTGLSDYSSTRTIIPECNWLTLQDWLTGATLDFWLAATEEPDRMYILNLTSYDRAAPEFYLAPILTLLDRGDDVALPGMPPMSWPQNLKVLCEPTISSASYPTGRHITNYACALPKEPRPFDLTVRPNLGFTLSEVSELAEPVEFEISHSSRARFGHLGRLATYDMKRLLGTLEILTEVAEAPLQLAQNMRDLWPSQYSQEVKEVPEWIP